jgi:hypothetical protein
MKRNARHRHAPFYKLAWNAPCDDTEMMRHLRTFVTTTYGPGDLIGFKEIRYGRDERYEEFSSAVDWLRELFPNAKIVLNTRATDTCVNSEWWAKDKNSSRTILERMRAHFERYQDGHPEACYWMPYEELKRGSHVLHGMFTFLGLAVKAEYLNPLDVVLR